MALDESAVADLIDALAVGEGTDLVRSWPVDAIHGFLALEHVSTTKIEHDTEYRHLLDALQRGLLHDCSDHSTQPRSAAEP